MLSPTSQPALQSGCLLHRFVLCILFSDRFCHPLSWALPPHSVITVSLSQPAHLHPDHHGILPLRLSPLTPAPQPAHFSLMLTPASCPTLPSIFLTAAYDLALKHPGFSFRALIVHWSAFSQHTPMPWRNNAVIAFGTLSSFFTQLALFVLFCSWWDKIFMVILRFWYEVLPSSLPTLRCPPKTFFPPLPPPPCRHVLTGTILHHKTQRRTIQGGAGSWRHRMSCHRIICDALLQICEEKRKSDPSKKNSMIRPFWKNRLS